MDEKNWEWCLDTMRIMLEDSAYDYASDTIEGIHDWVMEHEYITDKQKQAIENIWAKPHIDMWEEDYY